MSARQPGLWTVLRDALTWVGGWVIIFKQAGIGFAPPDQVNETLVWMAAVLVGVPGAAQLLLVRFGGGTSTAESSPPSPSSPLLPSSSSGDSSLGGPE